MKNTFKAIGFITLAVIIGFAFTACKDEEEDLAPETSGRLTITGLGAYSGKYVYAQHSINNGQLLITAAASLNSNGMGGKCGKIGNDGSVELKVWTMTPGGTQQNPSVSNINGYAGNDTTTFGVYLYNSESVTQGSAPIASGYIQSVTFINGIGSGAFEQ